MPNREPPATIYRGRVLALALASAIFVFEASAAVPAKAAASSPVEDVALPEGVSGAPDFVLFGGRIKTGSGWAQAVAVRDGVIVALGKNKEIKDLAGPETVLTNLGGDAVMPGVHDTHVHPYFGGLEKFACGFPPGAAPDVIVDAVRACADEAKPGEWVIGGNWVAAVFAPGEQTKALLDAAAPDTPVILNDEAHHSLWLNSRALELAGITADTVNPDGGIIEHGADGEPNGLLRETAMDLVLRVVPEPSEERKREALVLASNIMLANGITSMTIASVRSEEAGALAALSKEGLIKQRTRGCFVWAWTPEAKAQASERLIASRAFYDSAMFKADCVKMILDGVPTESKTAAMLEPYLGGSHGAHGGAGERGILMAPQDVLNEAVTRFDRMGLHIKFHAVGDAAVRAAIEAVEAARKENGLGGPMHDLGHNSFVNADDFARAYAAGVVWEFSPYIWYPTPIASEDIMKVVGEERMKRWIPIKEAIESGALVTGGSDWSVVPSVNPFLAIETMVTRQVPGGGGEMLGAEERVLRETAIKIMTENGARLMGQRDKVGVIDVGMRADFIVLDRNPYDVKITDVHSTKVKQTYVNGEKVYDASHPPKLSAR